MENIKVDDTFFKGFETSSEQGNNIKEILSKCYIDLSEQIPEPHPLISQGETLILSPCNISVIGGKAKSKKTFFTCALVTAFYSGECLGLTGKPESNRTILLIDTEQGRSHCQKIAKRIHRMCGIETSTNKAELLFLSLREYNVQERKELTIEAIKTHVPSLVILDGIRDLVKDINNADEATDTATMLLKLSTEINTHIVCVLHENKGDSNLRGHLGTELMNKAETVFSVRRDGETSVICPEATRNYPFEEFTFRVNAEGIPVLTTPPPSKEQRKRYELRELFNSILTANQSKTYTELVNEVQPRKGVQESSAKKTIAEAIKLNVILKLGELYRMNKDFESS